MRRLWLLFAQTVTVGLAIWFIVTTLKPQWAGSALERLNTPRAISPPLTGSNVGNAQISYRDAVQVATPSVVNIFSTKAASKTQQSGIDDPFYRKFFGDEQGDPEDKQYSLGSGVIVSSEGYILTNNHVVEAADEIEVGLSDGRKASAKVVGVDPETDLAVIKVKMDHLPSIVFGQVEQSRVGDVVLAIGNPFGVGQTVTMGIVSALKRNNLGISNYDDFIQTDAAINPGNSGGALVDTNGRLLGINTVIFSRTGGSLGIGFAIPVSTAKSVMDSIIEHGQVVRGWIGVEPQDITPELAESFGLANSNGVIIAAVVNNGPAFKAGMRPGDVLTSVEGKPVKDTIEMYNMIAQLPPGQAAHMIISRKSKESALTVMVAKRPPAKPRDENIDQK